MTQRQRGDVVDLLHLLAVHEAVEREFVPYVERRVDGAEAAVAERVEEEREVTRMLVALDALGPTVRTARSAHLVPHRASRPCRQGGEQRVHRSSLGDVAR